MRVPWVGSLALPLMVQVTAELVLGVTVAVNCWLAPGCRVTVKGEMVTAMGGVMVTCALADLVASATLVAVTVTVAGEGAVAGGVYLPLASTVPRAGLPPATPLTLQATAVLLTPVTEAVKGMAAPPASVVAEVGLMVTVAVCCRVTVAVA